MPDISTLESSLRFWEKFGYASTFVVFIGVVGESITGLWHCVKPPKHRKKIEKLSALILIAGLAGEIISGPRISSITGQITGNLNKATSEANERAARVETENLKLQIKLETATSELQLNETNLSKEQRKTANAQKETTQAQLELQKRVNPRWRNVILGDGKRIGESLKGNATSKFEILYIRDDQEAYFYALVLANLLKGAGWTELQIRPLQDNDSLPGKSYDPNLPLSINAGIDVSGGDIGINVKQIPAPFPSRGKYCAACALAMALGGQMSTDPRIPGDLVRIVIGAKP